METGNQLEKKKIIAKVDENKYNGLLPVHGNWKLVKKKRRLLQKLMKIYIIDCYQYMETGNQ